MKVITKQVEINRSLYCEEIENSLAEFGEPIRWAVVGVKTDKFIVEGVFLQQ